MNVKDAIINRRSVKYYDPNHEMSEAEVNELMELAILSPTSFNIQHWRFINVTDKSLREKIKAAGFGQEQITDASMLLIACADLNAWEKQPERYWEKAPIEAQNALLPMISNFYTNHHQAQRDEAIRSASLASMNIMLMAKEMGYDSCPMIGFDVDKVAKLIELPHDHIIVMMLTIGKKLQDARPRSGQLPLREVLFNNNFLKN